MIALAFLELLNKSNTCKNYTTFPEANNVKGTFLRFSRLSELLIG